MSSITDYLKVDSNIYFIGCRNTGKSYLARYILKCFFYKNLLSYVIIIAPTLYNGFWNCIPKKYQYNPTDAENAINKVLNYQKSHINDNIHACIIIDDSIGLLKFNQPWVDNLYTTCRHCKVTIITISQYVYKITPTMHANSDFVFILKAKGERSLLGVYKNYFADWAYNKFIEYIKKNTDNYGAIMINLLTKSNNFDDIFKPIKAPAIIKDFILDI